MVVSIPKETVPSEQRVGLVPELVPKLTKAGLDVVVQSGAGISAGFLDAAYVEKGARLEAEVFDKADIIMQLAMSRATGNDLKRIGTNISETKALLVRGSNSFLRDKVHEFHLLLANVSRNALYVLMMHTVVDVINQYMNELSFASIVSRKTVKEHETIYRYMVSGDSVKAVAAVRSHLIKDNRRFSQRAAKLKVTQLEYPLESKPR